MRLRSGAYLLLTILVYVSCSPMHNMASPNELHKVDGTLHLVDGSTVNGEITLQLDKNTDLPVTVHTSDSRRFYKLDSIEGYETGGIYYKLNVIKSDPVETKQRVFMRQLTKPDSKIQMYEHLFKTTGNVSTIGYSDKTPYRQLYYIHFSDDNEKEVWALHGNRFTPDFNTKMSSLIKECPALSKKILNKEDGYFFSALSDQAEKAGVVMMKIIKEYNECKQ